MIRFFGFRQRTLLEIIERQLGVIIKQQEVYLMATQAQIDKLTTDVAALITAGVAEINAAVAAAQNASADPAIDKLDADVQAATQGLTDAAAKLTAPTV